MSLSGQAPADYNEIFEKLLNEINAAQAELDAIQVQQKNQGITESVGLEAATLQEEIKLLKNENLEGFVEDEQISYYLAVGQVEQMVGELRELKDVTEKSLVGTNETLCALQKVIDEQEALVKGLENEVEMYDNKSMEDVSSEWNKNKKKELNMDIRSNSKILKQLKIDLKSFIDETANLDPDFNPADGSSLGYFLQALWKNFLNHGPGEYLSIEAQDFDVPSEVLEQLFRADIIQESPSNSDLVKMVDFTMSS